MRHTWLQQLEGHHPWWLRACLLEQTPSQAHLQITAGSRVLSAVLMGMMSWGITGRMRLPPASTHGCPAQPRQQPRCSTPANQQSSHPLR